MLYGKQTMSARVDAVQPDSAAATAGFKPGDLVVAIDGRPIESFTEMQRIVSASAGETLAVTVERDGASLPSTPSRRSKRSRTISATCSASASSASAVRWRRKTSSCIRSLRRRPSGWRSRRHGSSSSGRSAISAALIAGREAADQLGGPIRIAQMSGQVATLGFVSADSSGRGAVGLDRPAQSFPDTAARWRSPFVLPDRGVRGRPLSERAQEVGFRIGLAIVLMLMIFATFNDIVHLATS